jgi:hypothetical protein
LQIQASFEPSTGTPLISQPNDFKLCQFIVHSTRITPDKLIGSTSSSPKLQKLPYVSVRNC